MTSTQVRRPRRRERRCQLAVQHLEDRRLMAVTSSVDGAGALHILSDAGDAIAVEAESGLVLVNGSSPDTGPAPAASITSIAIDGGPGSNRIDLSRFDVTQFPALDAIWIDGGGGPDILVAPPGPTTFGITDTDAGMLGGSAFGSLSIRAFRAIPTLVGAGGKTTFAFDEAGRLTGSLVGGGQDILDFRATTTPQTIRLAGSSSGGFQGSADRVAGGFGGIDQILGGGGADTLIGEDRDSTWNLGPTSTYDDGSNRLDFEGIPNLRGGAGADRFVLAGTGLGQITANLDGGAGDDVFTFAGDAQLVGSLDGSTGFDFLDFASFGSSVTVQLAGSNPAGFSGIEPSTLAGPGFTGIDRVNAGGASQGSELVGEDNASLWSIGARSVYTDSGGRRLEFGGFATLQGGADRDRFEIGTDMTGQLLGGDGDDLFVYTVDGTNVRGTIDGQGGTNTLDLAGYTRAAKVDLPAGVGPAEGDLLRNIANARGGAGDDTLIGDENANVLDGRGGQNLVIGGAGNDTLATGGSGTLQGGPGDDTYRLAIAPSASVTVVDTEGSNTLDFSGSDAGIVLDLASTAMQAIAPGRMLQLQGIFPVVLGSPVSDDITVTPGPIPLRLVGATYGPVDGDVLRVRTLGRRGLIQPDSVQVDGSAPVYYSGFGRVLLIEPTSARLVLAQRHRPEPALRGRYMNVILIVRNDGDGQATGVVLNASVSPAMLITRVRVNGPKVGFHGANVNVGLGTIAPGALVRVVIRGLPLSAVRITSRAQVTSKQPNPDPSRAQSSVAIRIRPRYCPNLILQAIAPDFREDPLGTFKSFVRLLDPAAPRVGPWFILQFAGPDRRIGTADDVRIWVHRSPQTMWSSLYWLSTGLAKIIVPGGTSQGAQPPMQSH
ncbi:MAG: hypothetical protein U0800_21770 [Isosphaeraceae bacterium]